MGRGRLPDLLTGEARALARSEIIVYTPRSEIRVCVPLPAKELIYFTPEVTPTGRSPMW